MKVEKKDLGKSQFELQVELTQEEFKPYIEKGAQEISKHVKIDGFRAGKIPFDVLKKEVGEMTILEEGARIAINKTLGEVFKKHMADQQPVGQPQVEIVKLAPDNPVAYKVVVAVLPAVELGDYKDLGIKAKESKVEDKEVEQTIDSLREMRTKEAAVDREVKDGDKVIVDLKMFLDNVPVEGGQSQDAAVIIGKDYIVPGFDKKLLGAKKGEEREFSLPYPKDFHMKNLAGKMVEFKVKVKDVFERQLPEANDEFAKTLGAEKFSDLKENIKKNIADQKKKETDQATEREIIEKIIKGSKFGDLPEVLVNSEVNNMLKELEQSVVQQGGKFEDYLSSIGKSKEQLMLDFTPEAIKRVKTSLLIREVAEKEDIKVDEQELDKEIDHIKSHYPENEEVAKTLASPEYRQYMANMMASRKVLGKLHEWNIKK